MSNATPERRKNEILEVLKIKNEQLLELLF